MRYIDIYEIADQLHIAEVTVDSLTDGPPMLIVVNEQYWKLMRVLHINGYNIHRWAEYQQVHGYEASELHHFASQQNSVLELAK
jgi:hypothetical protein